MEQSAPGTQGGNVHTLPLPASPAAPMSPARAPQGVRLGSFTESTLAVVEGTPGGWGATVTGTVARGLLILPAAYLLGGKRAPRAKRLQAAAVTSVVASTTITLGLFAMHAIRRRVG